jgi:hypothetical protein
MATSPIYGWLEPDNTDLVKNGALAIRTLGNAIDTTMGTMTPKSIVDAKGDLIAASANDTPARLAVGSNGETLVADSSTSTGLRYTAGNVQGNPVINSAMQVWQRGTSVSVASSTATTYTADRWLAFTAANQATTVSRQLTNDSTNLPFIQYCARVQRNSGQTGTTENYFSYGFETINSLPYAGKTVTVSFYARAGANYSPTAGAFRMGLNTAIGTDQPVTSYNTGVISAITSNVTLTTTWQRFTATGTLSSTLNEFGIFFAYTWTGTAGANDWFEVTGVQLDVGSVALPFRTYAATIQGELAACQRYYRTNYFDVRLQGVASAAYSFSATAIPMRIQPTAAFTAAADYSFNILGTPTIATGNNAVPNVSLRFSANGNGDLFYGRPYELAAEL